MKVVCCIFWLMLTSFFAAANNFSLFEENGRVGLKNNQGQIVIPAQYEALGWSDGTFSVVNNVTGYKFKGQWGLINIDNHKITKPGYEELIATDGQLLLARKKSPKSLHLVAGCINTAGKEVIAFQYDGIKLTTLRAIVFTKIGNQFRYGLIDLENKTLIPQQFKSIRSIGSLRFAVENFDRKIALYADDGKQITSFTIDSISTFYKNHAIIYQNSRQGIMDREGQVKVEPKYRAATIADDGTVKVREDDEWQFLTGDNKQILGTKADLIEPAGDNLLKVISAGQVQLVNKTLAPVSPGVFNSIGPFVHDQAIVTQQGKYGILTTSGSILIEPRYDSLVRSGRYRLVQQTMGGKKTWTLLDSLGSPLTTKAYEAMAPLNGRFFAVRHRGFAGAIDLSGREIIACSFDSLLQTKDDLLVVKFRGQYGIINLHEEWKVTPRLNRLVLLGQDRFVEFTPTKTSLKSIDGNVIYFTENPLSIHAGYFLEYLPSGTHWKIDMDGRIIDRQVHPDEPVEKIFEESEGLRAIQKNGKFGFIDSQARLRIANRYEGVQQFSEGLAGAKIRGHWGFINHSDQIAIQPAYDEVTPFYNGFSSVKLKGLYGMINKNGVQVLPARYEEVELLPTGNLLIKLNGQCGLADHTGKILIQPRYDHLKDVGNNFAIVDRGGQFGVVTHQAISTVPLLYDYIAYDSYHKVFLALKKSGWKTVQL